MICRKCKKDMPEDAPFCPWCGAKQEAPKRKPKTRGNGQGTAYKRGKTWTAAATVEIKVVDGKKRQVRPTQSGFATKKEALDYIPQLAGRTDGKKPEVKTLEYYWELYKTGKFTKVGANTQSAYRTAWKKMSAIAKRDIKTLDIKDLQDCINNKAKTYDPAKDMQSVLSHCFSLAMAEKEVTVNLSKFLTLPECQPKEVLPFNEAEISSLWAAYGSGDKDAGYALLMIYSGMMPGELLKANKDMIDWDNQIIVGAGLKTTKRRDTPIVIADFMLPVLRDLCDYSKTAKIYYQGRNKFYDEYPRMLARCSCREELTPYSCRHTTATLSALNDAAQSVILEIMRQKKFTTTQRYIHIDVTRSLEAINSLKKEVSSEEKKENVDVEE